MSRQRDSSVESGGSSSRGGGGGLSKNPELADMQKKMKILKDAFVKERQEKENALKAKKDTEKEYERVKGQIEEKEESHQKYKEEIADLQSKLIAERKKNEAAQTAPAKTQPAHHEAGFGEMFSSSMTSLTGMLSFGLKKNNTSVEDFQKMTAEYKYSQKQLEVMKEKLAKAEGLIESSKKDARQQAEDFQKKLQDIEKELETKIQAYRELNRKYEDTNGSIGGLKRDKERIENDIARIKKENESLIKEKEEFERDQIEKAKMIEDLNEECQTIEAELAKHLGSLGALTSQLEEVQMRLQILDVKKAGKVMDTPAQIIMRKNVNDEYVLEIEGAGERLILFPQVIQSFGPVPDTEDKFYIDFKGLKDEIQRDVYHTDDRKKILKHFKTFLKLAETNPANLNNKQKGAINEKNLLTQMVSFFSN